MVLVTKMEKRNLEQRVAIKFCAKLGDSATETYGKVNSMNRTQVFRWNKISRRAVKFELTRTRGNPSRSSVNDSTDSRRTKYQPRNHQTDFNWRFRDEKALWKNASEKPFGRAKTTSNVNHRRLFGTGRKWSYAARSHYYGWWKLVFSVRPRNEAPESTVAIAKLSKTKKARMNKLKWKRCSSASLTTTGWGS